MKLKEMISEYKIYKKIEDETRVWIEKKWDGLSIDFHANTVEIVRTNPKIDYPKAAVEYITDEVNKKIGELLESNAEEIYLAERLERIWKRHKRFNPEIETLEDIKKNPKFLYYLDELIIKPKVVANGKL